MAIPTYSQQEADKLLEQSQQIYEAEKKALEDAEKALIESYEEIGAEDTHDPIIWDEYQRIKYDEYQKRNEEIKEIAGRLRGTSVNIRSATAPWEICYGRVRTGGVVSFVTTDENAVDPAEGGEWLHVGFTLACHEIDAIEAVYINKELVEWETEIDGLATSTWGKAGTKWEYISFISLRTLGGHSSYNWDLYNQGTLLFPGKWTETHLQLGRCFVYMIMKFDNEVFAGGGFPEVEFLIRGNNQIFDPRDDSTGYSNNSALVIAHHLTNTEYGCKVAWSKINEASFSAAADICDEDVTLKSGATQKRFTANGLLTSQIVRQDQLAALLTSCGGTLTYVGGQWHLNVAAWPETAGDLSLSEADTVGQLSVSVYPDRGKRFNYVTGRFKHEADNFIEKEFPAIVNTLYAEEDMGELIPLDVYYPFTTSAAGCQRLAKIELERIRQGIVVKGEFTLKAFEARVGDVIALTNAFLGFSAKLFEVTYFRQVLGGDGGSPIFLVSMELQETAKEIFDWNEGEETTQDLAPNTTLPSPSRVKSPTSLTLASGTEYLDIKTDGTIISRIYATWTAPTDPFVKNGGRIEIHYKKSLDSAWQDATPVPGDVESAYIFPVKEKTAYDVRIRARNNINVAGAWVTESNHFVLGKSEPPSDIAAISAIIEGFGIKVSWDAISDIDRKSYLLYYSTDVSDTWDDLTADNFIIETASTSHRINVVAAATYKFFIKAKDTSDNLSTNATSTTVQIVAPQISGSLSLVVVGNLLKLDWVDAVGSFAVATYSVAYRDTDGVIPLATIKGSYYQIPITWGGTRAFTVTATDVAGNAGSAITAALTIEPPGQITDLIAQSVNQAVILNWASPSTGSLNVDYYIIKKGAVYGSSVEVGRPKGSFWTGFETLAAAYVYWIYAVDVAGNAGSAVSIEVTVKDSFDFVIKDQDALPLGEADTISAMLVGSTTQLALPINKAIGPANITETWAEHFTNNSCSNVDDFITAGHEYVLQPSPDSGYIEQIVDFGVSLGDVTVSIIDINTTPIAGACTLTTELCYSENGTDFSSYSEVSSIFCSALQAFKIKVTVETDDGTGVGLIYINEIRYRVNVRRAQDAGSIDIKASELATGGTDAALLLNFVDLESATCSPSELVRAAKFVRGNSEFLNKTHVAALSPGDSNFTIACWVRMSYATQTYGFFSKWADTKYEYRLVYASTRSAFAFYVSTNGSDAVYVDDTAIPTPQENEWYLLVGIHDATNNYIRIQVNDGGLISKAHSAGINSSDSSVCLGRTSQVSAQYFNGQMRNAGYWARCLSTDEITALYQAGLVKYAELSSIGGYDLTTNLTSFWELTEDSGDRKDSQSTNDLKDYNTVMSAILPVQTIATWQDDPNPTNIQCFATTEGYPCAVSASWSAFGIISGE